jgi:hypothetical protein
MDKTAIITILYIYNHYSTLPYILLKDLCIGVRFILAELRLPSTFNIFFQSVLPLNYVCVGRFASTFQVVISEHIYFKNCRATDYQELVNGSQIVGEETSNRCPTVTNLFTDNTTKIRC